MAATKLAIYIHGNIFCVKLPSYCKDRKRHDTCFIQPHILMTLVQWKLLTRK